MGSEPLILHNVIQNTRAETVTCVSIMRLSAPLVEQNVIINDNNNSNNNNNNNRISRAPMKHAQMR